MEIRIFSSKYLPASLIRIYWKERFFIYFLETKMIYERKYSLENLIETYKEITLDCIEDFTYNDYVKTLQEYLSGN